MWRLHKISSRITNMTSSPTRVITRSAPRSVTDDSHESDYTALILRRSNQSVTPGKRVSRFAAKHYIHTPSSTPGVGNASYIHLPVQRCMHKASAYRFVGLNTSTKICQKRYARSAPHRIGDKRVRQWSADARAGTDRTCICLLCTYMESYQKLRALQLGILTQVGVAAV